MNTPLIDVLTDTVITTYTILPGTNVSDPYLVYYNQDLGKWMSRPLNSGLYQIGDANFKPYVPENNA